jgi:putative DNA primase/helicase
MNEKFKGYIKTKGKQAIEKFKNRKDFKTFSEVRRYPEYAGVLADDVVLVDIDDKQQSEILYDIVTERDIQCDIYRTTRGMHFYFKNTDLDKCGTHLNTPLGLQIDVKLGCKNSYAVMRYDGVNREQIRECEHLEKLPHWLKPINNKIPLLVGMEEGNRNQTLFNYILTLQSEGMGKEDIRETLKLVNEYVLDDPLSEKELDVILRDEAFEKPNFFQKEKFLFDKFSVYLKNTYHIAKLNGQLCIYRDGIYTGDILEIESQMIKLVPTLRKTQRREVLDYLNLICEDNRILHNPNLIAFRNGVLDLMDIQGGLKDYSPEMFLTNKIDWNFDINAYSELADKTLDKMCCNDPEIRAVLEECIGSCLYSSNQLAGGKAFILTGAEGSNGKSTFLDVLTHLVGKDNCSALDLSELSDRFSTVMLYNKMCNVGDDIADDYISNTAIFKKIVTGNAISAEYKGRDKFNFIPYCKLLFSANNIPRLGKGKDTRALKRRLVVIPFNAKFSPEDKDYDPFIKFKLMTEESIQYLIKIGIDGLMRVLKNNAYTVSTKVETELNEFELENNPLLLFMQDMQARDFINESTGDMYRKYDVFCAENNISAVSKISFSKQICSKYNLKVVSQRVGGEIIRIFKPL